MTTQMFIHKAASFVYDWHMHHIKLMLNLYNPIGCTFYSHDQKYRHPW